jgi:hypothetical protein
MISEKLCVFFNDLEEFLSLGLIDLQGASLQEIQIFFGGIRI